MILLYTLLLVLLGLVKFLVERRAAALERRYAQASLAVEKALREPGYFLKEGNSSRVDLTQTAKRYFTLGLLAQKRDRLEVRHYAWQGWTDKLGRLLDGLRGWKGKKLPYTLGALDVWLALYLIDYFGVGEHVSARRLFELVKSYLF